MGLLAASSLPRVTAVARVAGVLLLALVVRLWLARFYYLPGDLVLDYYPAVQALRGPALDGFAWGAWYARLGVILPLALADRICGGTIWAVPCVGLAVSVLQLLLVYALGCSLWDRDTGLRAATLMAVYPVCAAFGATALPDPAVACATTAAMLCLVRGFRRGSLGWYFLCGACIGLGYMAKDSALLVLAGVGGAWVWRWRDRTPRDLWVVAAGLASCVLVEILLLSWFAGHLVFRPLSLLRASAPGAEGVMPTVTWARYVPGFFGGFLNPLDPGFVEHGLFGIATLVAFLRVHRTGGTASLRAVGWWWLGLLSVANFACLGLSRPFFPYLQMRGVMFLAPASCLLLAAFTARLSAWSRRLWVIGLVSSSLLCGAVLKATWAAYDGIYREVVTILQEEQRSGTAVFFHDPYSAKAASLLLDGRLSCVVTDAAATLAAAPSGSWAVVVNTGYLRAGAVPAGYLAAVQQPGWRLVRRWESSPGVIGRLLDLLAIPVKKGLSGKVWIYQRIADGGAGRRG